MKLWLYSLLLLFVFSSCEKKYAPDPPKDLISESVYLDLFYEIELLRVLQYYNPPQELVDSLNQVILDKHNIDGDAFLASHRYYQSQVGKQEQRVDIILGRLEDEVQRFKSEDSLRSQASSELKE